MPSESVADIYEEIREDPLFAHLRTAHIRLVPGIGSTSATYLLVGEAPGATENTKGRPFCGASGRVLDQLMGVAGISVTETIGQDGIRRDANAWLTNVVKYRPPGNRTPTLAEVVASRDYLRREWRAVGGPYTIVLLGATAKNALAAELGPMGQVVGQAMYRTPFVFWPMYHPAKGLYEKRLRPVIEEHWERLGEWIRER